ncbi:iron-containing alcohol dehydrogenase family protein [Salinarchaeum laminariae]|uniref:iron-containing alcohol dehydrogenase family protein n=1 Tax=Salinarchaeum laminariae TaxID=869888 RepID=UPI0035BFCB36
MDVTGHALADGSGPFRFAYQPGAIRYGDGAVASLGDDLATLDLERALVVTGSTVGDTAAVMDPIRQGLGDRLAGLFAETTPEKRLATAIDGANAATDCDADVLVAVGSGSSIDTAKAIATIVGRRRSEPADASDAALGAEFADTGTLAVPAEPLPIVTVPTTLAGADFTQGAGLSAASEGGTGSGHDGGVVEDVVSGGLGDPALAPTQAIYDPTLVATTPRPILAGSAMNGFDKALETLYSRHATAITDATAARSVRRFREGLLAFGDGAKGEESGRDGVPAAVEGLLLAQYGISRADCTTMSVIHAFGQEVSAVGDVQQGVAHAICAPHALAELLAAADVRTGLLADAFGVADAADPETAIVEAVAETRDALGVTTQLRDVDGLARDDLAAIAAAVAEHRFLDNGPAGYEPTAATLEAVLDAAW